MDINVLKNVKRIFYNFTGNRSNKHCLRLDRNENVEDWDNDIFNNIYKSIKSEEITGYPPNNFNTTVDKYSKYLNINSDNLYLTNGSDDAIREFFIMYVNSNSKIGINAHTYGMYDIFIQCKNCNKYIIDYNIDTSITNLVNINKNKLYNILKDINILILTNPNQISNNDLSFNEYELLIQNNPNITFLIDETYNGFGQFTLIPLIQKYKNLLICQSASKTFGLASIRLGGLIGHKDTILPFLNFAPVYKTNIFSSRTLEYYLDNTNLIKNYSKLVIEGKNFLINKLVNKNYKVNNSNSNCIFILFNNEINRNAFHDKLYINNIYTSKQNLIFNKNIYFFIRITCGPIYFMEKITNFL